MAGRWVEKTGPNGWKGEVVEADGKRGSEEYRKDG